MCAWINLKLFGIFFSGLLFRENYLFLDFSPFCADILKENTRGPFWSQSRFREIVSNHLHFSNIVVVITQIIMTTFPFLRLFHRTLFVAASVPCPYSKAITLIVSWWDCRSVLTYGPHHLESTILKITGHNFIRAYTTA